MLFAILIIDLHQSILHWINIVRSNSGRYTQARTKVKV